MTDGLMAANEEQQATLDSVLETVLYTQDMAQARAFFENVLSLQALNADSRFTAYPLGSQMLLIFRQGETSDIVHLPQNMGTIPPHDGGGRQHVAFAIAADALAAWEQRLADNDVAIEGRTHWPRGGESIYFRDPYGHLLELATPGIWPAY